MKRAFVAALVVLLPAALAAQTDQLAGRLDDATRAVVTNLIVQARAEGLPERALVNKALEGASKGATGTRIIAAVSSLADNLRGARRQLGQVTDEELVAGAAALRAGVQPAYLAGLRRDYRGRLVTPLATMADLVMRGVPADTAARVVVALARAGAREEELLLFRQNVERDIALGASAGTAAAVRMTAVGRDLTDASVGSPTGDPPRARSPRRP